MTRRSFLTSATAGALTSGWRRAAGAQAPAAGLLDHLGVALYTVRDQMKADPAGTLKAIASLGYRYVEGPLLPSRDDAISAAGLAQASAYAPTYLVTGNRRAWAATGEPLWPESYGWGRAVDEAKRRGLKYLVIVYLQRAERGGLGVYRELATRLAKAGEACRRAGLGLAYHPHAFEYEPIGGVRPIDLLLSQTPPELLGLELDTFWASLAGVDPVTVLARYRGRIPLVHLKDKARATPVQYDEARVPRDAFKEIGQGEIDFARLLPAAARAGVKYYYVEQDYCPGNPLDSLRLSRQALARAAGGPRPP